jgi:hypothetical protein
VNGPRSAAVRLVQRSMPFLVLTWHFFSRLFQNDIFPFEEQLKEKLFAALAILGAFGGYAANLVFIKYMMVVPDYGKSWEEKCFFLTLFMLLLAFAVVLEWDVIFLDKRDFANLMPLPVRPRTVFFAKFSSFFVFIGLYTLAVNALAVFVVAIYLAQWKSRTIGAMIGYMAAHTASAAAANFAVFFLIVFIQSVLLVLLSPAWFKRVSLFLRFVLLAGIFFLLLMFLVDGNSWRRILAPLAEMKAGSSTALLSFPPMWFTGLYEVLLGSRDPGDLVLARTGLTVLAGLALVYFAAMRLSYKRHLGRSLEVQNGTVHFEKLKNRLAAGFNALVLRNPVERAVFGFFGKALKSSPLHKVRLAGFLAAALGMTLILFVLRGSTPEGLTVANRSFLAGPLILSFFLLAGLRTLVGVPLSAEANWVFQLAEEAEHRPYFVGTKKAVFFLTLLPLFGAMLPFYAWLWGVTLALLHLAFGLTCSLVLLEALFWKFPKIPFACSPAPGKANLHILWAAHLAGFLVYVVWLDKLEQILFRAPSAFPYFFIAAGVLLAILELVQKLWLYRRTPLIYEEEPEPALVTLEYRPLAVVPGLDSTRPTPQVPLETGFTKR